LIVDENSSSGEQYLILFVNTSKAHSLNSFKSFLLNGTIKYDDKKINNKKII